MGCHKSPRRGSSMAALKSPEMAFLAAKAISTVGLMVEDMISFVKRSSIGLCCEIMSSVSTTSKYSFLGLCASEPECTGEFGCRGSRPPIVMLVRWVGNESCHRISTPGGMGRSASERLSITVIPTNQLTAKTYLDMIHA